MQNSNKPWVTIADPSDLERKLSSEATARSLNSFFVSISIMILKIYKSQIDFFGLLMFCRAVVSSPKFPKDNI